MERALRVTGVAAAGEVVAAIVGLAAPWTHWEVPLPFGGASVVFNQYVTDTKWCSECRVALCFLIIGMLLSAGAAWVSLVAVRNPGGSGLAAAGAWAGRLHALVSLSYVIAFGHFEDEQGSENLSAGFGFTVAGACGAGWPVAVSAGWHQPVRCAACAQGSLLPSCPRVCCGV